MSFKTLEISDGKGKWVGVPALDVRGKTIVLRGNWLRVARVHSEDWLETELENPEECIHRLTEPGSRRTRADIFTFSQKLPRTQPKHSYPMEWDSVAAARTASFDEWWRGLPQETRKNVRRSQKRGAEIRVEEFGESLVCGIMNVNNESRVRQGLPNNHYGKCFEQVRQDHCSFLDRSDFICARVEGELIGFLKLVYRGDIASILNLAVMASHSDKRPANALVAKAVELCEAKRITYLTYGMFNYGNKRHGTLRQFKIRNGFEEVRLPRYYIPLTRWGALAVRLKLHRGLIGILPEFAIRWGLAVRAALYQARRSMGRCSSMIERPKSNRLMERSNPPAGSN